MEEHNNTNQEGEKNNELENELNLKIEELTIEQLNYLEESSRPDDESGVPFKTRLLRILESVLTYSSERVVTAIILFALFGVVG